MLKDGERLNPKIERETEFHEIRAKFILQVSPKIEREAEFHETRANSVAGVNLKIERETEFYEIYENSTVGCDVFSIVSHRFKVLLCEFCEWDGGCRF